MSTLPFNPDNALTGRYILFADLTHDIQVLDESVLTQEGDTVEARWKSQALNRQDPDYLVTLNMIVLKYSAKEATSIVINSFGDGVTIAETKVVALGATTEGRLGTISIAFRTTGNDIRFEIIFPSDVPVAVAHFRPILSRRGTSRYAGRGAI